MSLELARDELATALQVSGKKIVFAESCTAGLCSSTMAQLDGMSNYLCGSAVTYRPAVKHGWLAVNQDTIETETCESQAVANEMALGVLGRTPEADLSAAVVGHTADGTSKMVFISIAYRMYNEPTICLKAALQLGGDTRIERQREAAKAVLRLLVGPVAQSG